MNWGVFAALLIVLTIGRFQLRRWVLNRWAAKRMSDRHAKSFLALISLAPFLLACGLIAVRAAFPWNLVLPLTLLLVITPFIGMGVAALDYESRYGPKRNSAADDERV
jgi:uncharacterized membrane protein YhaH (DUF805 family)